MSPWRFTNRFRQLFVRLVCMLALAASVSAHEPAQASPAAYRLADGTLVTLCLSGTADTGHETDAGSCLQCCLSASPAAPLADNSDGFLLVFPAHSAVVPVADSLAGHSAYAPDRPLRGPPISASRAG